MKGFHGGQLGGLGGGEGLDQGGFLFLIDLVLQEGVPLVNGFLVLCQEGVQKLVGEYAAGDGVECEFKAHGGLL